MSTFYQNDPSAGKNFNRVKINQEFYAPILQNLTTPPEDPTGGAVGYYNGSVYFWNGTAWTPTGGGGSSDNIYNSDGTITDQYRTVDLQQDGSLSFVTPLSIGGHAQLGIGQILDYNTFSAGSAFPILDVSKFKIGGSESNINLTTGLDVTDIKLANGSLKTSVKSNTQMKTIDITPNTIEILSLIDGTQTAKNIIDYNGNMSGADAVNDDHFTTKRQMNTILQSKGQPNGIAPLGTDNKIPSAYIPALSITETFIVSSQSEMLSLIAQIGDIAVRTDTNETYILKSDPASTLSNWIKLLNPAAPVQSVDGKTGNIDLSTDYIKNDYLIAQGANFNIIGSGKVGSFKTPDVSSDNSNGTLNILGGAIGSNTSRGGEIILRGGGASSNPGGITLHTGTSGSNAIQPERMRINASGNVGIGIQNPNEKFCVSNNGAEGLEIYLNNVSSIPGTTGNTVGLQSYNRSTNLYTPFTFNAIAYDFKLNSTDTGNSGLIILPNGNVGIGENNPKTKLQVNATGDVNTVPVAGTATGCITLADKNGIYGACIGIKSIGDTYIQSQRIDGATTLYNILLNPLGGNVGIGTGIGVNPLSARLDVNGDIRGTAIKIKNNAGAATCGTFDFDGTTTNRAIITSAVTANSIIMLTIQSFSASLPPTPYILSRVVGSSFNIQWDKPGGSTGSISYMIIEPS